LVTIAAQKNISQNRNLKTAAELGVSYGKFHADHHGLTNYFYGTYYMKPIANLDEVEFTDVEDNGYYTSRRAQFSDRIGARKVGYNLTELPPGKAQCPFHNHHNEEEMFLILEGEGELRFGANRYAIRKHDVIACPTGGPEVAHQIINTGTTRMRYLALSTTADIEVCEYPDSNKILVSTRAPSEAGLSKIFRSGSAVDYYDGENNEPPRSDT